MFLGTKDSNQLNFKFSSIYKMEQNATLLSLVITITEKIPEMYSTS